MRQSNARKYFTGRSRSVALSFLMIIIIGCNQNDPEPVNEEEVITTIEVGLMPEGGGNQVTLRFFDEDGELGNVAPIISASGSLKTGTVYMAEIRLLNETVNPPIDVALEVSEEAEDHLFCFSPDGSITVTYEDEDANGLPVGLMTSWEAAGVGNERMTVSLRHQPGTKDGNCPGTGDTDVEVTFDVTIE